MSSVKIKTEPTTTATATAAVDGVQVKLEPSLSAADINFEQHTSDIDTKVEYDSEADIKSENDDNSDDGDTDQDQASEAPSSRRQYICEYPGCGRGFKHSNRLGTHRHEHKLQVEFNILGKTYILTRHSLDDRWSCTFPDCTTTLNTIDSVRSHFRNTHSDTTGQHQQSSAKKIQRTRYFVDVDFFYVNGVRCSYHTKIGVFICHVCKLVPECLLTHLQQRHGFDEKSIDNSVLPESAINANADPSVNQHTNNPHLAAAIREPYRQQHQNIVQGWMCVTSKCGYCGHTAENKSDHKKKMHRGEQLTTVPALVLRLVSAKSSSCYFLVARLDTAINRANQHRIDYSHDGLNAQDENGVDIEQNETADVSIQKQKWKCEYHDCERLFNSTYQLSGHRREHKLEVVVTVQGTTFTLSRQSLEDRWSCPLSNCKVMCKTVDSTRVHIQRVHKALVIKKRANSEDDNSQQVQVVMKKQRILFYLNVNDIYIGGTIYGYHTTTKVFICHICRLVPDCLLTHLKQKHGFDEKSIDNSVLPESARINGSDPNENQHTSNSHLSAAIRNPYQWRNPDIIQGWLCIATDCGHCCSTKETRNKHQRLMHRGKQESTVPALVLRLLCGKIQTSCFLITRLDTITSNVNSNNSASQQGNERDEDDGDELVLSDYSDDDDIY